MSLYFQCPSSFTKQAPFVLYYCKSITLIHALTQCFYFCPSCALYRPLQVRIYFSNLKVDILYVWFSLQTLKDAANYNFVLDDSNCYHGTRVHIHRARAHSHNVSYYQLVSTCSVPGPSYTMISNSPTTLKDRGHHSSGKPAQVAQKMCGWDLRFVTSSRPKLMLFFLYSVLASHTNPLIPAPFMSKAVPLSAFMKKISCVSIVPKLYGR